MLSSEILAVLADEVTATSGELDAYLSRLAAADGAEFEEVREDYLEQVQRVSSAAEVLNLVGLERVCAFVKDNLGAIGPGEVEGARQACVRRWPQLLLGYLRAPKDGVYAREMVELFRSPDWLQPLDAAAAAELEQALLAIDDADPAGIGEEATRQTEARPEDVRIDLAPDLDPQLVDVFLAEGPVRASDYSALIQRVVRGEGWADELNEARRLIHALKGEANTVDVRGVAALCHHVEDILEHLVDNAMLPEGQLAALLVKVADTLEMMFEAMVGTGEAPPDAQAVLQAVLDWANRLDRGEPLQGGARDTQLGEPALHVDAPQGGQADEAPEPAPAVSAPEGEDATAAQVSEEVPEAPEVGASPSAASKRSPEATPTPAWGSKVRVPARVIDDMLRVSGEMAISRGHILERLQQTSKVAAEMRERHGSLWQRSSELEGLLTTQGIAAGRRQAGGGAGTGAFSEFDALELDEYGELHTHVHGLTEAVADLRLLGNHLTDLLAAVDATVAQQTLLNNELHEHLLTSRMVPAGTLASRLDRAVRQAAERCGKSAALDIRGADVMLDDQMINVLVDPLLHLLRNAVDHGLEAVEQRTALGKQPIGQITMVFARDGNYLVVTCADDGAGLDMARIRARAVERGLITADQEPSQDEIARLILRPGFSTAGTVTEVSGRGVGMDIVNTRITKLKGSIGIRTDAARGTTFTLRVPISMGIAHCLLATAEGQTFAIPTDDLDRIVFGGVAHVEHLGHGWLYRDGETGCPAYSLGQLAGYRQDPGVGEEGDQRHVVLVNDAEGKAAVVVDAVTSGQDLVIKGTGRHLSAVPGLIGASILGDGSVVPILEMTEILRRQRGQMAPRDAAETSTGPAARHEGDVLVVDDSLSVRTALSTLLTEEGFEIRTAKDGVEAIEAIDKRLPAAVLVDFEMPRMNGVELTMHLRANPATRSLPVIMVTSRTTQKHRSQAEAAGVNDYVTKPYRESDLLMLLRSTLGRAA
jgi:chemotaxis protein histidine kinase CheA/CheY-like chemotaxis protein